MATHTSEIRQTPSNIVGTRQCFTSGHSGRHKLMHDFISCFLAGRHRTPRDAQRQAKTKESRKMGNRASFSLGGGDFDRCPLHTRGSWSEQQHIGVLRQVLCEGGGAWSPRVKHRRGGGQIERAVREDQLTKKHRGPRSCPKGSCCHQWAAEGDQPPCLPALPLCVEDWHGNLSVTCQ